MLTVQCTDDWALISSKRDRALKVILQILSNPITAEMNCAVTVLEVDFIYHHGKHNSCCRRLDDPQQHQTCELHQREDVDLPQRHIAQIDQIGLVLGRHAEQSDPVKELQRKREERGSMREKR